LISEQWLNSGPSQPVSVSAPPGVALVVEGERVRSGFEGMYFPDVELVVDVAEERRAGHRGWRINGREVSGAGPLRFTAEVPTRIQAVFEGQATEPMAAPVRAPVAPPPPARVVWRTIPAGSSWMGCVPRDTRCDTAETPRVRTVIAEPFQMMDREVSAADFRAYAAQTGRHMPLQPTWYADDTHPVVNVTWDEAQAFCSWVGGRLPTEPEWEHAARGGLDGELFPWGSEFTGQAVARHNLPGETYVYTAPVGSFPPNAFGLHDMAGNVWELTSSEHHPTHATEPTGGYDLRTIKGGAWDSSIRRLRVSEREAVSRMGRQNLYVGFRCVRSRPK
jgi:formylglycine-generating enzyme required for sulfatase activity